MARSPYYPPADRTAQNFASAYVGAPLRPDTLVVHSTEGLTWPGYDGGAKAPHWTARPDFAGKRLVWRQHYPCTMSARALANPPGGVETNREDALQVELIGTCDPRFRSSWTLGTRTYVAGRDYLYWPQAPEWALRDLAALVAWLHSEWSVPLSTRPTWLPYPQSYGQTSVRMSASEWLSFAGVCGHQHVPENTHGDPGNIDIARVLALAADPQEDDMPLTPADVELFWGRKVTRGDGPDADSLADQVPAIQELADAKSAALAAVDGINRLTAAVAALSAKVDRLSAGGIPPTVTVTGGTLTVGPPS